MIVFYFPPPHYKFISLYMFTPSRGTRQPVQEIDPTKHHQKCVCEICTCGKVFLKKGNTVVHPRRCRSREKQRIITTTSHIIWHMIHKNASHTIPNSVTMTQISSKLHTTPITHLTESKKTSSSNPCSSTSPQEANSKARPNTKRAMSPIRSAWSDRRRWWSTHPIAPNSMQPPHIIESIRPNTPNTISQENIRITNREAYHFRARPPMKANTNRTGSSPTRWRAAGISTNQKMPNSKENHATKRYPYDHTGIRPSRGARSTNMSFPTSPSPASKVLPRKVAPAFHGNPQQMGMILLSPSYIYGLTWIMIMRRDK